MAEPLNRPAFMVLSRANGGVRMELRKGHRSVRRSFTPEEAQLLMFMLATALADFDQERAPDIAKQAVLCEIGRYGKKQHGCRTPI